jgi:hypothetical protein
MSPQSTGESITDLAIREVVELHYFFSQWLGTPSKEKLDIARLAGVLDPGFRLVAPDGGVRERQPLIDWIAGVRASRGADFRVDVADFVVVWQAPEAVLLEYLETQYIDGKTTKRLSTALFCREPKAPCGVVWRHLQETWLQDGE